MAEDVAIRTIRKKIGVFGHVGNENLGDEALIAEVIRNIKLRYPDAEVCGYTLKPEDTRRRHGIPSFPIRRFDEIVDDAPADEADIADNAGPSAPSGPSGGIKGKLKRIPLLYGFLKRIQNTWFVMEACIREPGFLYQCYRNLSGVDLLVFAGSSQLIDYVSGGAWGHPYTIWKWVLLARARKTRVAFLSCGAGPIQTFLGRFFLRSALSLADYKSYRDEVSSECAKAIGARGPSAIYPDLAYGTPVPESSPNGLSADIKRPLVGINPVPFSDPKWWVGSSPGIYADYVGKLADFACWLVAAGYDVMFFPTQLRADPPAINDIHARLDKQATASTLKHIVKHPIGSFDELAAAIQATEFVVATRFHGVVLGFLFGKPVIGIAYASKTEDLMKQMGQEKYAMDILGFDLASLQDRFRMLESERDSIEAHLESRVADHREALNAQYREVFALLEGARGR